MRDTVFIVIVGVLYLATLYALVRPGSNGPVLVNNIFNALSDLVRGSVGYTYDQTSGKWNAP